MAIIWDILAVGEFGLKSAKTSVCYVVYTCVIGPTFLSSLSKMWYSCVAIGSLNMCNGRFYIEPQVSASKGILNMQCVNV